jgi:hypothetical protein
MFLESMEETAARDVAQTPAEAISDSEIDSLIEAETQAEKARESQEFASLRAELAELKGEKTDKEAK